MDGGMDVLAEAGAHKTPLRACKILQQIEMFFLYILRYFLFVVLCLAKLVRQQNN